MKIGAGSRSAVNDDVAPDPSRLCFNVGLSRDPDYDLVGASNSRRDVACGRSKRTGRGLRRGLRCHHGIPEADQWSTTSHPSLIVLSRVCNDEFEDGMVNSDAPERYVRAEYASWGSRGCQLPGRQVRRYRHLHPRPFYEYDEFFSAGKRQLILVRRSVGVVAANNGTPQTQQQKTQQCLNNFYNSTAGKAVQFGSPLALLPGWNPQWGNNLQEWGIAIVGKLGGLFGSGAMSGTTQLTTLSGTTTVGSTLELGTGAVLGAVEKMAPPAMALATVVDVGAHLNCGPAEPSPDAWIQGAATPGEPGTDGTVPILGRTRGQTGLSPFFGACGPLRNLGTSRLSPDSLLRANTVRTVNLRSVWFWGSKLISGRCRLWRVRCLPNSEGDISR